MGNKDILSRMMRDSVKLKQTPFKGSNFWLQSKQEIALIKKSDYDCSIAFSLEGKNPADISLRFPYFKPRGGLGEITKICDVIVLTHKDDALRAFAIEVKKSRGKDPKAQIINGAFFCKWLHSLLEEHYGIPKKLEVSRVLCVTRKRPLKDPSHRDNMEKDSYKKSKILEYAGVSRIYLEDIHNRYKEEFGFGEKRQKAKQREAAD